MDDATRTRVEEAVAELKQAGIDENGIRRVFGKRGDGRDPLEVIERQLRYRPFRDAPPKGTVTGQLLAAILGDWAAPARWLKLWAKRVPGGQPAPEENAQAYRPAVPPIGREEVASEPAAVEREERVLLQRYFSLPSARVRLPDGRVVVERHCPSPAWAVRTEELREILGKDPWPAHAHEEGAVVLGAGGGIGAELAGAVGGERRPGGG